MSELYADAVRRVGHVMDTVEAWLERQPDGSLVTPQRLQQEVGGQTTTFDQAALAHVAFTALGIISPQEGGKLNRTRLQETAGFRLGVRAGLENARAHEQPPISRLIAALPPGLPSDIERTFQREADDLRASLVGLLASAQEHLLVASPFWDDETATDLGDLLERRLQAGVQIDLLGREETTQGGKDPGFVQMVQHFSPYAGWRAFTWYKVVAGDRFGTQTFHFKCIVADFGQQAYLGSANLTAASLRSRMELGILLTGKEAQGLSRLMTAVLKVAHLWKGA